ncbi:MAG: class I SAM-dependent methyltransferase [Bacteroidetes bacterium]|nr:class I SAM-dependent methyltransferase [Bacteroidota bacterium]
MESKIKSPLKNNISETLYIPLYMKSVETVRENPIINDPWACNIITSIDYDFKKYDKAVMSQIGSCLRARHFDDMTKRFISEKENPIVVILGCGLDSRSHRIGNESKNAIFYQIDLEEVIKLRERFLPPLKNEHFIAMSMFDTAWMQMLKKAHPKGDFIFIIEGVIMYFREKMLKSFFENIANNFKGGEVHFDTVGKMASRHSSHHDALKNTEATFKFGVNDAHFLEKWDSRFRLDSYCLYGDFKEWSRVGFFNSLLFIIFPFIKRAFKLCYYKID